MKLRTTETKIDSYNEDDGPSRMKCIRESFVFLIFFVINIM